MTEDYFAGAVAERYDATLGERGDPAVVAATGREFEHEGDDEDAERGVFA